MKQEVIDALNKQKAWVREAARQLLQKRKLSDDDITAFVGMIKNPPATGDSSAAYPTSESQTHSALRIQSIGEVVGIDALKPRKPLQLGEKNLTVIYGANGSGKSGYARIITKASGARHGVELKPDVFKETPQSRQCTLKYLLDGEEKSVVWDAHSGPISDFDSVNVFDTENGRLYLERENELSYEIPELALFSELVSVCKRVDAKLSTEKEKLVSKLPQLPPRFVDTASGKAYSAISASTTPDAIDKLFSWGETDSAELKQFQRRLQIADPAAEAKKKREVKKQVDLIHVELSQAAKSIDLEGIRAVKDLRADATKHRADAKAGAKALGGDQNLNGIGTGTWKAMWEAAREFSQSEAYPNKKYPNTGDKSQCVLCQQDLLEPAKKRLADFELFVQGTLETEAVNAERLLSKKLEELPLMPEVSNIESASLAAKLTDELAANVKSAYAAVDEIISIVRMSANLEQVATVPAHVKETVDKLKALSLSLETEAATFDKKVAGGKKKESKAKLVELEARKWAAEQVAAIRAEVERLKEVAQYETWKKETATTSLSRQAGILSQTLITKGYVKRFNDELDLLGAKRLDVELVKTSASQGRVKHAIRLCGLSVTGVKPIEVLSEGERRIVAVAAFLADVTGQQGNGPFIFDDPISSLDQSFEEKIIKRLIKLGESRQVIVFTHRLSFLGMMNDFAGNAMQDVFLRREHWGTGEPSEVPLFGKKPDKALKALKNDRLASANKILESDGSDVYYPLGKAICSDFRILMERVIEVVFLADVVQRHRRAIKTMGKVTELAKITSADCQLVDKMMTKYSCHEHSQSNEAPVELPNPEELGRDIQEVLDWHVEFSKRRQS